MSRSIKFRAWDMKECVMVIVTKLYVVRNNSRYELMQYTGLKDKNGKEIYEGDKDKRYGEVVFSDGCFKYKQSLANSPSIYIRLSEIPRIAREIIDNIYESNEK